MITLRTTKILICDEQCSVRINEHVNLYSWLGICVNNCLYKGLLKPSIALNLGSYDTTWCRKIARKGKVCAYGLIQLCLKSIISSYSSVWCCVFIWQNCCAREEMYFGIVFIDFSTVIWCALQHVRFRTTRYCQFVLPNFNEWEKFKRYTNVTTAHLVDVLACMEARDIHKLKMGNGIALMGNAFMQMPRNNIKVTRRWIRREPNVS